LQGILRIDPRLIAHLSLDFSELRKPANEIEHLVRRYGALVRGSPQEDELSANVQKPMTPLVFNLLVAANVLKDVRDMIGCTWDVKSKLSYEQQPL
jgi:hypothetical protein